MYYKTSDNLNLYFELQGNPNSLNYLIFLNGLTQSTSSWDQVLPAFASHYQVLLCDFIFQGKSDKQGNVRDFDQHAADVYGLINSLNINKISLIGISYGSIVAQNFTLSYPEKVDNLILLSTFAHKTSYSEAMELALDLGPFPFMMNMMLPMIPFSSNKNHIQNANNDRAALIKLMTATRLRGDYREKLKGIKKPTLIIHGEKDNLIPVHMGREVSDSIEASRFEIIQGAGHTINTESTEDVIKLIKEFIY